MVRLTWCKLPFGIWAKLGPFNFSMVPNLAVCDETLNALRTRNTIPGMADCGDGSWLTGQPHQRCDQGRAAGGDEALDDAALATPTCAVVRSRSTPKWT